jgi:DNA-binding LacI/PurR family transcriptional regulator
MLGATLATRHLIELGHKRIGLLGGEQDWLASQIRKQGWRQALADAGLPAGEDLVVHGAETRDHGYEMAVELLNRPDPPTAIFAINDYLALGACSALLERDLRPGQDIAIVGYDDVCCSQFSPIALTTVRQPKEELGVVAAELLKAAIRGEEVEMPCMSPSLVVRQSCGGLQLAGGTGR